MRGGDGHAVFGQCRAGGRVRIRDPCSVWAYFFTPIKNRLKKRKRAKAEAAAKQNAYRAELKDTLAGMNAKLCSLSDDIGDLQYERLSQAYDFYTTRGWCTSSKKLMLCKMHKSYRAKNRNHLSEHFEQEILDLPDKPKKTESEEIQ